LSPVRSFAALAASRMFSIRERTLVAVSVLLNQIGFNTPSTIASLTSETGTAPKTGYA
jgi:hypothetical protein